MDVRGWFEERIDPTQAIGGVAAGDVVAITVFVVVGQLFAHGGDPIGNPVGVLEAAAPFYIAWLVVALLGGLYTRDALVTARRGASWSTPAWIFGVLVAQLLRATPVFSGNASVVFALVSVGVGGLLVVGWRTVAPVLYARMQD